MKFLTNMSFKKSEVLIGTQAVRDERHMVLSLKNVLRKRFREGE